MQTDYSTTYFQTAKEQFVLRRQYDLGMISLEELEQKLKKDFDYNENTKLSFFAEIIANSAVNNINDLNYKIVNCSNEEEKQIYNTMLNIIKKTINDTSLGYEDFNYAKDSKYCVAKDDLIEFNNCLDRLNKENEQTVEQSVDASEKIENDNIEEETKQDIIEEPQELADVEDFINEDEYQKSNNLEEDIHEENENYFNEENVDNNIEDIHLPQPIEKAEIVIKENANEEENPEDVIVENNDLPVIVENVAPTSSDNNQEDTIDEKEDNDNEENKEDIIEDDNDLSNDKEEDIYNDYDDNYEEDYDDEDYYDDYEDEDEIVSVKKSNITHTMLVALKYLAIIALVIILAKYLVIPTFMQFSSLLWANYPSLHGITHGVSTVLGKLIGATFNPVNGVWTASNGVTTINALVSSQSVMTSALQSISSVVALKAGLNLFNKRILKNHKLSDIKDIPNQVVDKIRTHQENKAQDNLEEDFNEENQEIDDIEIASDVENDNEEETIETASDEFEDVDTLRKNIIDELKVIKTQLKRAQTNDDLAKDGIIANIENTINTIKVKDYGQIKTDISNIQDDINSLTFNNEEEKKSYFSYLGYIENELDNVSKAR